MALKGVLACWTIDLCDNPFVLLNLMKMCGIVFRLVNVSTLPCCTQGLEGCPEVLSERHVDATEHVFESIFLSHGDKAGVEAVTSAWAAQEPNRAQYLAHLKSVVQVRIECIGYWYRYRLEDL